MPIDRPLIALGPLALLALAAAGPPGIPEWAGTGSRPVATSLPLHIDRLVAGRDSFAILIQGAQIGFTLTVTEPHDGGVRLIERSSVGGFVEQTTTLEILADGSMAAMKQEGTVQGESTVVEIDYRHGRARGAAHTAAAAGPTTVTIDTVTAPGTIDENAVQGLLPALPWAGGASWSFPVFSASQNETRMSRLAVEGVETVERPGAPPVDAFRAVWTGAWQPATFWITTATPHRVVRIAIEGAPLDIVRAN